MSDVGHELLELYAEELPEQMNFAAVAVSTTTTIFSKSTIASITTIASIATVSTESSISSIATFAN